MTRVTQQQQQQQRLGSFQECYTMKFTVSPFFNPTLTKQNHMELIPHTLGLLTGSPHRRSFPWRLTGIRQFLSEDQEQD